MKEFKELGKQAEAKKREMAQNKPLSQKKKLQNISPSDAQNTLLPAISPDATPNLQNQNNTETRQNTVNEGAKKRKERIIPNFDIIGETNPTRELRRKIERINKKKKCLAWVHREKVNNWNYILKDNTIPLSKRSKTIWKEIDSLKPNKFEKGHVPINIPELKEKIKSLGFNRNQCTELFICYFTVCLYLQFKSPWVLKNQENFICPFGFNNSYNDMSWTTKRNQLMQKIINRLKALNWIQLIKVQEKIHKTEKIFYKLIFKSLNKWSKKLTPVEKDKAKKIRSKYLNRGKDPPAPFSLLGINH